MARNAKLGWALSAVVLAVYARGVAAGEGEAARRPMQLDNAALQALAGEWDGAYAYPVTDNKGKKIERDPVQFSLVFTRSGDRLTGRIKEPNTFGRKEDPWLHADVIGVEMDARGVIIFRKQYDGTAGVSHGVFYGGSLSADKTTISGTWWIPGDWSSKFVMKKKP